MARYEAHLHCPGLELASFQQQLNRLADTLGVELTWLDQRNASMAQLLPPQGISVQLLLEFRGHGEITCLLSSREGMGKGAPQSRACFEQVLALLAEQLPAIELRYRSDRDGPIRQR
ncbi:hypothetical protein KBY57_11945 [Cyanobium sp. Aljojuca 7D2]|uniref:hypothetical protein n=1 Tax=Cyanobium sp. Aljojuca 7D2 TaxID=2823698 RepID=UPI0020CE2AB7|nr:hypothetical protein [Cyanobium sp. Aljojuca 7D2]MCP9891757.1 hypothetical protein [Cyanobium sp. Aljojuca 7D2]